MLLACLVLSDTSAADCSVMMTLAIILVPTQCQQPEIGGFGMFHAACMVMAWHLVCLVLQRFEAIACVVTHAERTAGLWDP
ncbi:hypothetical protein COO60DRAFT_1511293 [Scenedesmus sp. NREL 46B-D3]|nr:hypothetical protein COO60DRAFT_1511293 [Scenedesmus sp. NREL 46B-D3]